MKIKQTAIILLMTILFIFFNDCSIPKVQAYQQLPSTVNFFSSEATYVDYDGSPIEMEMIEYKLFNINRPAYCLNINHAILPFNQGNNVKVQGLLNNMNIWRVIKNGYPNVEPIDLKCESVREAYVATQIAIYASIYDLDLTKFTPHDSDNVSHSNAINAAKTIAEAACKSTESKITAIATIKPEKDEWQTDADNSNFLSKTYSLQTSAESLTFDVKLIGNSSNKASIEDMLHHQKTSFEPYEKFKIKLPIQQLEEGETFQIQVTTHLKTYPVFYANQQGQEFAIPMGYYEPVTTTITEMYDPNQTEIVVQTKDGDNEQPLQNAVFQIASQSGKILYSDITTNERGEAILKKVIPGTYLLKQIKVPEGYDGYEHEVELQVKWNERCYASVDNFKLPTNEYQPKPQDQTNVTASEKKDIKILPRAGC